MIVSDMGIDLGTASVLVYIKGRGIVLHEPSIVAVNSIDNSIIAIGLAAYEMTGRVSSDISVIRPLREGVISDYDTTETMLKYFIQKAIGKPLFGRKPRISVCIPSVVTTVERRAVEDATKRAGARKVYIIEEPVAAAIGCGINIARASGSMVVDIGGGTTDIAVISLGTTVVSSSLKVAGDTFNEAIIKYIKNIRGVLIGERTAEALKMNVGSAYERIVSKTMEVRGRNLATGLPKTISVSTEEMTEALSECASDIVESIIKVLEQTPPELSGDIYDRGIVLTGGGALLYGLDLLIKEKTGITTIVAEDALSCVAIGTGKYMEYIAKTPGGEIINSNYNYGRYQNG